MTLSMNKHIIFTEEPARAAQIMNTYWKIIIVDDEPEVHAVTRLALSDFTFLGRSLEFFSAFSGEEGCKLMREHPDAAIILLDVVMETDDAGLRVAHYIREELDNHLTRIIVRTGQPGRAPERTVIINYDINDYRSKTELTAQKLFAAVMTNLRSYRDIVAIEQSYRGLQNIVSTMAKQLLNPPGTFATEQQSVAPVGEQMARIGQIVANGMGQQSWESSGQGASSGALLSREMFAEDSLVQVVQQAMEMRVTLYKGSKTSARNPEVQFPIEIQLLVFILDLFRAVQQGTPAQEALEETLAQGQAWFDAELQQAIIEQFDAIQAILTSDPLTQDSC